MCLHFLHSSNSLNNSQIMVNCVKRETTTYGAFRYYQQSKIIQNTSANGSLACLDRAENVFLHFLHSSNSLNNSQIMVNCAKRETTTYVAFRFYQQSKIIQNTFADLKGQQIFQRGFANSCTIWFQIACLLSSA